MLTESCARQQWAATAAILALILIGCGSPGIASAYSRRTTWAENDVLWEQGHVLTLHKVEELNQILPYGKESGGEEHLVVRTHPFVSDGENDPEAKVVSVSTKPFGFIDIGVRNDAPRTTGVHFRRGDNIAEFGYLGTVHSFLNYHVNAVLITAGKLGIDPGHRINDAPRSDSSYVGTRNLQKDLILPAAWIGMIEVNTFGQTSTQSQPRSEVTSSHLLSMGERPIALIYGAFSGARLPEPLGLRPL